MPAERQQAAVIAIEDQLEGALVARAHPGHEGVVGAPAGDAGQQARARMSAQAGGCGEGGVCGQGPGTSCATRAKGAGWQLAESFCPPTILRNAMPFFSFEGSRLSYTVYGEGSRTCVLVHALLLSQKMHRPLARALAERGNRVVTLDLLGHGRSDRPSDMTRYSMPAFGQQMIALLDHLEVDDAVLGGTSLGANATLEAAVAAPERVRGMVVDMPVLDNALMGCAIAFTPLMVALSFGEPVMRLVRARRARSRRAPPRCSPTSPWTPSARTRGPARRSCTACSSAGPRRTRPLRRTLAAPALVIGHQRDPVHPFSDSDALVAELPDATARAGQFDPRAAHAARPPDRRDRRLPRHVLGGAAAAAVRRGRGASPRLPIAPWPTEQRKRNAGARSASPRRRRPGPQPPAGVRCRSAAAWCSVWPSSR